MRILANYGYKNNGDSYSVTFETMGDVAQEHVESTVDELFRLAKSAIDRQMSGAKTSSANVTHKENESIVIPEPRKNGRPEGRGLASDSQSQKHQLKDPDAPATNKQKSFIARLAKEKGTFIDNLNSLTMAEASQTIGELMAV